VLRQRRTGERPLDLKGNGFDDAEICAGRYPVRGIPIEMLLLGIDTRTVNGFYEMVRRRGRSPESSGQAESERANGYNDQQNLPSFAGAAMSMQLHLAV